MKRPSEVHKRKQNLDEILISGNERFTEYVERALSLIKEKDPETYQLIKKYVREIKQNRFSGMNVHNKIYKVGDITAFESVEWLAGTIAHDSTHSRLYWDYRENNGFSVPDEIWTGQKVELICNEIQAKCLERIGAPREIVDYVRSLDGSHYVDSDLRDW